MSRSLKDISAAIFDIDGTLLDSSGVWAHLGSRFLRSRGQTPPPETDSILAPMTLAESARWLHENALPDEDEAGIRNGVSELIGRFYREECQLREGAAELVRRLSDRGVRLTLATAGERTLAVTALERCGIMRYFAGIFTCDEYGGKGSPEIFLAACGSPETCAVFEDSLAAVRTAKSAGYLTAAVRDVSEPDQDELRRTADFYHSSLLNYLDLT